MTQGGNALGKNFLLVSRACQYTTQICRFERDAGRAFRSSRFGMRVVSSKIFHFELVGFVPLKIGIVQKVDSFIILIISEVCFKMYPDCSW